MTTYAESVAVSYIKNHGSAELLADITARVKDGTHSWKVLKSAIVLQRDVDLQPYVVVALDDDNRATSFTTNKEYA